MLLHLLRLQCLQNLSAVNGLIGVPWFPMISKRDNSITRSFDQGKGSVLQLLNELLNEK